jgi:hypothetical protein
MTRTRIALTATTLGLALAVGAGAYAASAAPPDVTAEAAALQTAAAPQEQPGQKQLGQEQLGREGDGQERVAKARRLLRKNTLHGEMTVQGEDGVRTIVVQRGTVTATDGKTISVKSSDGFTLTWTAGDKLVVRQDKEKSDASAIKAGAQVGIAGARDGDKVIARLVRIG